MPSVSHVIALVVSLLLVLETTPSESQSTVLQSCTGTVNPELCTLTERGELSTLDGPNFATYQQQIQDFYAKGHYGLAWLQYKDALVEAVKHFQQRHGLTPDGRIDPATFRELTVPLSFRAKQLQFTLERYRWLPADLPTRLIVVNIPEFVLRAYDNHHPELSMKVIVGRAFRDHQTPIFQDEMEYLIFRPYWNVPIRIVRKELVPDIQKKSGFLAKHQFQLVDGRGQVVIPETIGPAILQRLRAGQLDVRQKPGSANSLGLIKFVFPNYFDIYLHGTPEQQLFSRSRRDFSHGCIRVEDPATLAHWVLRDDPSWTMDRIQAAMDGSKSFRVDLPKPIPVLILYGTALVEENGEVHFFQDIYGQDARMERSLASRLD